MKKGSGTHSNFPLSLDFVNLPLHLHAAYIQCPCQSFRIRLAVRTDHMHIITSVLKTALKPTLSFLRISLEIK